jgi:hypothetical protein
MVWARRFWLRLQALASRCWTRNSAFCCGRSSGRRRSSRLDPIFEQLALRSLPDRSLNLCGRGFASHAGVPSGFIHPGAARNQGRPDGGPAVRMTPV